MLGVSSLADVSDFNVADSGAGSMITGASGQQVAFLFGVNNITMNDLDFGEI